jgi:hypothetical protein
MTDEKITKILKLSSGEEIIANPKLLLYLTP